MSVVRCTVDVMARGPAGHIERLPSGSWRVKVYAGIDPLTGREIRLRRTCKTERAAQIELGKLLEQAVAGRQPDSAVTVSQLLDQYVLTAGWDVSTRESNLGYIRRTIKPAIGSTQVRKVRGPLLDTFTEHRNIPDLRPDPADPRLEWQQAADRVRAAISSGQLASGDTLPSVPDLARLQGLKPGTVRHAFLALAEEGLVHIRHGRTTTIAGEPPADEPATCPQITRPRPGHDCRLSGCRPHVCKPMAKSTIHGIHSILSGAFEAAMRWEWTDRNPARSAKPPTLTRQTIVATSPEAVAKVIAAARAYSDALGLYFWLVMVTGVRRGELCGLQIRDVDLDRGLVHVAFNYVVRAGQRISKDTKTHQDRWLAIDPVTCALIAGHLAEIKAQLAAVGVELRDDAYLFSNDPAHARPWNPDWVTHKVADAADAAAVELDIKGGRHYTASQLLAGGFDLRNTAARLGHSGGGATTLRHYADPVPEVDRRAAAYLAQLTAGSATQSG
jgi:integrase